MRHLISWPSLLILAACGGGGDPTGVFAVSYHTRNDTGCAEGAAVTTPPYFQVDDTGELAGITFYAMRGCDSSDPATCSDFIAALADGPAGLTTYNYGASSAGGGTDCLLTYQKNEAELDGDELRLEVTSHEEIVPAATSCTTDDAEARSDSMPCVGFEVIVGSR